MLNPGSADRRDNAQIRDGFIVNYLLERLFLDMPSADGPPKLADASLADAVLPPAGSVIAWACGLQRADALTPAAAARIELRSARGPLTARQLGLEGRVPLGHAAFLLPLVYDARTDAAARGGMVCVPHVDDNRSDEEILASSGADQLLRAPAGTLPELTERFIDRLAGARFVLCGSVEVAALAAAYRCPFAFWDSGFQGDSFPWTDLAASLDIPSIFHTHCASGGAQGDANVSPDKPLPPWLPLLSAAPYGLRPHQLRRLLHVAGAIGVNGNDASSELPDLLDTIRRPDARATSPQRTPSELERQLNAANSRVEEAALRVSAAEALSASLEARTAMYARQVEFAQQAAESARRELSQVLESSSWRLTAPYRALRNWTRPVLRALERLQDLPSRCITPPLMLPAYLAHKGDLHGFYKSWRHGGGFMDRMIAHQAEVHERLQLRGATYRAVAARGFALAVRLHEAGGVLRALDRLRRILFRKGAAELGAWLEAASPRPGVDSTPDGAAHGDPPAADSAKPVDRRILVADYRVPRPDVSAGEKATVGIARDLAVLGFEVTLLAVDMAPSPRHAADLEALGIEVVTSATAPEAQGAADYVARHGSTFGTFYLIRVDVAEALLSSVRKVAPHARVIFHAPDLYFLRELRAAALRSDTRARLHALETRDRELNMMRQCDHVVLVSPAEVPVLKPLLPHTPVSVFSVLYAKVEPAPAPFDARNDIFFLGGFGHPPNLDAVEWFVRQVWPQVRVRLPGVEFHIVGADAPAHIVALGQEPGVRFVGYVADLDPVMRKMRVGVAPLLVGAGVKGKVAATMGAGIPCVCTPIAAEGMGIENGVHALVAERASAFAEAVVMLYTERALWEELSTNGRRLVEERFGAVANRASLIALLDRARALPLDLYADYWARADTMPAPAVGDTVDVSIVVPAYNHWDMTRACLASVISTNRGCTVRYEIIVADDGSTDDTRAVASHFPGVRHVPTAENQGFLGNCNHAAAFARGRHLLLLNNDTVVFPNWLQALYDTMEADASIAIVGSKLLYPDGTIQEAGGGLRADASGVSIGRWIGPDDRLRPGPRDHPAFNFEREVDYLSGASILVRRTFWDEVGGFDERYRPAYCEDSDLAMAARAGGWRVVYQPRSEVVHFEHRTYESADARHRTLMQANGERLLSKWADALRRDHLPAGSPWHQVSAHADRRPGRSSRDRRRGGRYNILYFSPFPSHPSNHGNQATIQQFALHFQSLGHSVHFALLQSHMYSERDLSDMRAAWDSLDVLPNAHPLGADGQTIAFDGWYEDGLGEAVAGLCGQYDVDIVFCSYVFQSKLLEFVPAHALRVIDTHDKMGNRYEMLREKGQPLEFFSCTPAEEGAYLRRADLVVARRAEEAAYFNEVTGRNTAIVIPHFEAARYVSRTYLQLATVGVVASANRINVALLEELLAALQRQLRGKRCPFDLQIAGQVRDLVNELPPERAAIFRQPWVRLCGFVPDIAEFYAEVDAVVSPVTMGTGINVKTVQALAFGVPLLSTAWGTKGIPTQEPHHRHATMDDLVRALLELAQEPSPLTALAEASRACYEEFLRLSVAGFETMLTHPKLTGEGAISP